MLSSLPFYNFPYCLNGILLDHCESEKDLGLHIHERLSWTKQFNEVLAKATQQFNLLRRTCYFVKNQKHKRALYLTLIRSLFEHGNCIWSPSSSSVISKFESIQKRAIKWILSEQFYAYSDAYYMQKLVDLDILPMAQKFVFNDMVLFFKILTGLIPVALPQYVNFRSNTRSSSSNGSTLGIDSVIVQNPIKNVFGRSFFPRCISTWNSLSPELKASENIINFKAGIKAYLWQSVLGRYDSDTSWEAYNIEPD